MYFSTIGELIAMDGHGSFVWLAYGTTVLVLVVNLVATRLATRKQKARCAGVKRLPRCNSNKLTIQRSKTIHESEAQAATFMTSFVLVATALTVSLVFMALEQNMNMFYPRLMLLRARCHSIKRCAPEAWFWRVV